MIMKLQAFTDVARSMITQSEARGLKSQQSKLSSELASGETSRPLSHLRGDVTILTDVTRTQALTKQYLQTTVETDFLFQRAQSTLSAIKDTATTFIDSLLMGQQSGLPQAKGLVEKEAASAFSSLVSRLNEAAAGRQLFSGQATNSEPLPSAEDFKAQVDFALLGATSAVDVQTRLDAFFASGGFFEAVIYKGSTEALQPIDVSDSVSVRMDLRADDPSFRTLLKSTLLASATGDVPGLSQADKDILLGAAQAEALTAKDQVVTAAGELGVI